jgi:hypothetical protein
LVAHHPELKKKARWGQPRNCVSHDKKLEALDELKDLLVDEETTVEE